MLPIAEYVLYISPRWFMVNVCLCPLADIQKINRINLY